MTRFARAKGSKSSNEKVPEDATPWSQLKKDILIKQEPVSEETKKCVTALKLKIQEEKPTKWVSLDNEDDDCLNIFKKHLEHRRKCKDNLLNDSESILGEKKLIVEEGERKKTENVQSQVPKKKKKGRDECQDHLMVSSEKINKRKTKKNSEHVFEDKDNDSEILQNRNIVIKDDVTCGQHKKKRRNDLENSNTTETVEKQVEGKIDKKRKKSDRNSSNHIEEIEENMEKSSKKKSKKAFAGEELLKEKKTFCSDQSVNAKKLRTYKTGKKKINPDKLTININGELVDLVKFQGFYITKADAERLKELRKKMMGEGIPEGQIAGAIKLERRRCEKALARMKKNVCFQCRKPGHQFSECPDIRSSVNTSTGVCYKCGSTEHKAFTCRVTQGKAYPFAECFICKEKGHIARECPDNPRGLYPKGGCCKLCGDVTHLKRDCPKRITENEESNVKLGLRDDRNVEDLEDLPSYKVDIKDQSKQKKKPVRF